jgi:hypothetical protein
VGDRTGGVLGSLFDVVLVMISGVSLDHRSTMVDDADCSGATPVGLPGFVIADTGNFDSTGAGVMMHWALC